MISANLYDISHCTTFPDMTLGESGVSWNMGKHCNISIMIFFFKYETPTPTQSWILVIDIHDKTYRPGVTSTFKPMDISNIDIHDKTYRPGVTSTFKPALGKFCFWTIKVGHVNAEFEVAYTCFKTTPHSRQESYQFFGKKNEVIRMYQASTYSMKNVRRAVKCSPGEFQES